MTNEDRGTSTRTIYLVDVFRFVEKERYPFLWNEAMKTLSFMPTSASCEQSISCLKHRLHVNMKKTNAFNFLLTSQSNSVFYLYKLEMKGSPGRGNPRGIKGRILWISLMRVPAWPAVHPCLVLSPSPSPSREPLPRAPPAFTGPGYGSNNWLCLGFSVIHRNGFRIEWNEWFR